MAWIEKYNVGCIDLGEIQWLAKIYGSDFAGTVTTLKGQVDPIVVAHLNESDDIFDPIKEVKAVLSIESLTSFQLDDLFSNEDMYFYVEIYQGIDSADTLYWAGYVDNEQYQEAYEAPPYAAEIHCIDGLALLREILYEDDSVSGDPIPYNGRKLKSQIILDILGKIGFTEFKEFINVYEVNMNSTTQDSLLDQSSLDVDVFAEMYCDEVLKEVLKGYNACIKQKDGIFCIYRPKALGDVTVYGRYFTDATTKTLVSYSPTQFINRTNHLKTGSRWDYNVSTST
jgi:hypothetical protein